MIGCVAHVTQHRKDVNVWLDEKDPVQRTIMREWQTYRDAEMHSPAGEDAGDWFEGSDVPAPEGSDVPTTAARRKNSDKRRIQKLLDQPSKFGRCPVHGAMLQPHVHKGGKQAGAIRCYCRRWFNWQQDAKRCWYSTPFNMQQWALLDQRTRDEYQSLRSSLARGSRE